MSATPTALDAGGAAAEELAHRRFALMAEQVASLRWSFVLIVAVIAAIASTAVPNTVVAVWLAGALLTQSLRLRTLRHHAVRRDANGRAKLRLGVAWNVALGLVFGASALFMAWLDLTLCAVLTTIVVSSAAGAVAISGPLLPVYAAYTLSIMVPFAIGWAAIGGVLGLGLAALMVVFVGVQYRFARQVSQTFIESFLMRQANESLVEQLTQARDEADAANRAKTRFLAAASHDLRQPLHALSLQSSALMLDPRADDTPQIAQAIAGSIEDVSALLNALLDISKLDAGTLQVDARPIYLSKLVDTLARSMRPVVEAKGLRFDVQVAPDVVARTDPLLVERVLRNLLDNAVKFTERGHIELALRDDGESLAFAVADTGVGIDPALHDKVFEEFFQVDRHALGHAQGLGLGLSIVGRLASLLGMTVALDSGPGRGTRFTLRLPARPGVAIEAEAAGAPSTQFGGLRVLVLDDDPAIRAGMGSLLRRLDCEVFAAEDTDAALRLDRDYRPEVVLADLRLGPGEDGITAVARLRAQSPGLLALLISGDTAPERLREADESGLALLHKPLSLAQLKAALAALVSQGG